MSLFRATVLISVASLLSRVLGVVRENLLASRFGGLGDGTLDAYYAAFRIPDFLFNLVILSVGSAIFVPLFSRAYQKNAESINEIVSNVTNICSILILIVTALCYLFVQPLGTFLTLGFAPDKRELTIELMKVLLLTPFFFTLSSVVGSYLNTRKNFSSSIWSPIAYNLSIIASILLLVPKFGVHGLAYGVLVGSILHIGVQLFPLFRKEFHYHLILDWSAPYLIEARRIVLPRMFAIGAAQLNLMTDTILAGMLAAGSLSVLNWVQNIQYLPMSLVGISVSITAFTTLSEHAATQDMEKFMRTLSQNLKAILLLILPATVGLILVRTSVIDLLLNYGKFQSEHANLTLASATLFFYAIGLPFQTVLPLLNRVFYALEKTTVTVIASLVSVVINIGGSLLLAFYLQLGLTGLALAFSVATACNVVFLCLMLGRTFDLSPFRVVIQEFFSKSSKIFFCTLVMAVLALMAHIFVLSFFSGKGASVIDIVVTASVGGMAYWGCLYLFRLTKGWRIKI